METSYDAVSEPHVELAAATRNSGYEQCTVFGTNGARDNSPRVHPAKRASTTGHVEMLPTNAR